MKINKLWWLSCYLLEFIPRFCLHSLYSGTNRTTKYVLTLCQQPLHDNTLTVGEDDSGSLELGMLMMLESQDEMENYNRYKS